MSSSSTTTEPTARETPEVSGDDNANARAAVHSANKPGAAYAAAVANGESERAWIRRVVLLLTGQAFSLLGSSIVQYAIWWWIVLQTRTGSAMLLATLFGVVPQAVVSIFGGSWADRHSRKLLIMLPDMVIAVVTVVLSLSFAMGWASLTMIFVVLFIRSAGGGVQTPAVQSFIPDVVPSGKLLRVNSIYGVINSANTIVAPAVAAVLINTVPLWSILLVDVTTAIIGVGFVALIKAPKKSAEHVARRMAEAENSGQPTLEPMSDANADRSLIASVRRVFADLKDGFSYTWRRANLRNVVLGGALVCFVSVAPMNLTLLLMTREYEGIDLNLGFINLTTASDKLAANELGWSIGMLLGGALMSTIGAKLIRNNMRVVAFGIALVGVSVVGLGVVHNLLAYLLIDVVNGLASAICTGPMRTIIQTEAEADAAYYDALSKGHRVSDGQQIPGRKDAGDYEWCNRYGSARDADGNEIINAEDMFYLGNVVPHSTGGISNTFRYKRLTLSIYLDYALGHSIYNYMKTRMIQNTIGQSNSAIASYVYDCWKYPGDTNAKYARYFPNDGDYGNANWGRASDFNVEKADYLCLRDVSLYYDLPERWVRKLHMKKLTVGITCNTIAYWTGVTGAINPETGMGATSSSGHYTSVSTANSSSDSRPNIFPPTSKFLFNLKVTF